MLLPNASSLGLTITPESEQATVEWGQVATTVQYKVEYSSVADGGSIFSTNLVNDPTVQHLKTGLTPEGNYWVRVTARNSSNVVIADSGWVAFTMEAEAIPAPTIQSATVTNADKQRVVVIFTQPMDPTRVPLLSDFSFANGTLTGTIAFYGNASTIRFDREFEFAPGEVETFNYTPNAGDPAKRLRAAGTLTELAAVVNHPITNNVT